VDGDAVPGGMVEGLERCEGFVAVAVADELARDVQDWLHREPGCPPGQWRVLGEQLVLAAAQVAGQARDAAVGRDQGGLVEDFGSPGHLFLARSLVEAGG